MTVEFAYLHRYIAYHHNICLDIKVSMMESNIPDPEIS